MNTGKREATTDQELGHQLFLNPLNFVAVILKYFLLICLPLWTLPTFIKNKKNVWKMKKTFKNEK